MNANTAIPTTPKSDVVLSYPTIQAAVKRWFELCRKASFIHDQTLSFPPRYFSADSLREIGIPAPFVGQGVKVDEPILPRKDDSFVVLDSYWSSNDRRLVSADGCDLEKGHIFFYCIKRFDEGGRQGGFFRCIDAYVNPDDERDRLEREGFYVKEDDGGDWVRVAIKTSHNGHFVDNLLPSAFVFQSYAEADKFDELRARFEGDVSAQAR